MTKIWIDVTTTMAWSRAAVGIVRVEQELIKYALSSNQNVGFFKFQNSLIDVVSEESLTNKINELMQKKESYVNQTTTLPKKHLINKSRLKHGIYALLHGLFEIFSSLLSLESYLKTRNIAKQKSRKLKKILRRLLKNENLEVDNKLNRGELSSLSNPFSKNDIVISIGLSWDHGEKFEYFYQIRKEFQVKIVSMCYDLIPIKHPSLTVSWENSAKFEQNYVNMTWASDLVLSISEHSKRDYIDWINEHMLPQPKIEVIKLGSTIKKYEISQISDRFKSIAKIPFILFVSTIERRKNHETIVKSIQYLIDKGVDNIPQIVFVGMKGWGVNDFFIDFELNDQIKKYVSIYHSVNDDELSFLYENCKFFIYPSFYEGWGLPIAEGLTYGKFGISSNTSSMPEVGKNLLDYLYPYDVVGWANRIMYYIENPSELSMREQHIKENFQDYTWESFSQSVFKYISEI